MQTAKQLETQAVTLCQLISTFLFYFAKNEFLPCTRRLEQSVELKHMRNKREPLAQRIEQRILNKLLAGSH